MSKAADERRLELIPQQETGAADFPHRGQGVLLGVLDTGVDPGAQHDFSLLDVYDCTGSGDVPLEDAVATLEDESWTVQGLTGRTVSLPREWDLRPFPGHEDTEQQQQQDSKHSSVPVRLGIKAAYEFFPSALVKRLKEERKRKLSRELAGHVADARAKLAAWHQKFQEGSSKPSQNDIYDRDDAQALLDILTDGSREDPGPVFDCVVFYDGTNHRVAVVETTSGSDSNLAPHSLAAFGVNREFQTFSTSDQLRFAVQFYDNYKLLSIVVDSSPHGSHVAHIAAGVAPDVSVISFKIGEPRLGSMETGPALRRAMQLAVKRKCDVINLSYGESTQIPDSGHLVELARELVWKHGIVFVAAAGNQGPALSTVKALGGTTTAVLGIAAAVSPEMRTPVHSLIPDKDTESTLTTSYTWSSTGPAANGYFGVDLMAPGAAIAGVPSWLLQKCKLMNGTSMASPHAAGCVALLLSACKANGISTSPNRIRRALENTAVAQSNLSIPQQGWGMINVPEAWKYLETHKDDPVEDWHFHVSVTGGDRGIYLRQREECITERHCSVFVRPEYKMEDEATTESQAQKLSLELKLALSCSAPWVEIPDALVLMNNGRSFEVRVDPSKLEPGLHVTRVYAKKPTTGQILFSVPVTVAKPIESKASSTIDLGDLDFSPAEVRRFFVVPPPGSTWMDITLRDTRDATADATSRVIGLHTLQLLPHARFRDYESNKRLGLLAGQTHVTSVAVVPGVTAEVALARFWSTRGPAMVEANVTFRGVRPSPDVISIRSGSVGVPVRLSSDLANESIDPKVKLTRWQFPLTPKQNPIISVMGERDTLDDQKKTYQMVLEYEFEQKEKGSIIPRAPGVQGVLYESGLQSQCMLIYDGDKKYLGMSDAYPSSVDVPKGKISIRLQLRHANPKLLERYKGLTIWIEKKLGSDIPLSVFSTRRDVTLNNGAFKKVTLRKGKSRTVFVSEPDTSKLPDGYEVGHRLLGVASYASGESLLLGEGKRPGGFPVTYNIGSKQPKESSMKPTTPKPSVNQTLEEKIADAVREVQVGYLDKLTKDEKEDGGFEALCGRLLEEYPDHLPLLGKKLRNTNTTEAMLKVADQVISRISEDELALNLGRKVDPDDGDAVKERDGFEEKKTLLIEALFTKALASLKTEAINEDLLASTIGKLNAWDDLETSKKYSSLFIAKEIHRGRLGRALARVNQLIVSEEKGMLRSLTRKELLAQRSELLNKLGWEPLAALDGNMEVLACPKEYTSF